MQNLLYIKRWLALLVVFVLVSLIFSSSTPTVFSTDPLFPTLIESDDALVGQEGTWTAQSTASASGGSYLYSSGSTEDVLTLNFEGTSVEIVYVEHAAFGTMAIEIDHTVMRTVVTTSEATVFDVRAVIDYLEPGSHVLRVYAVTGTIAVDAFYALPPTLLLATLSSPQLAQSPDLRQIAYRNCKIGGADTSGVCIKALGATDPLLLVDTISAAPVWSREGNRILYGAGDVLKMLQGWEDSWTVTGWSFDVAAELAVQAPGELAWSSKDEVAFSAEDGSGVRSVYCIRLNGDLCDNAADYRLVTGAATSPSWNPEGTEIVYEQAGTIRRYEIGGADSLFKSPPDDDVYKHPDWSPKQDSNGTSQIAVTHFNSPDELMPNDPLDNWAVIRVFNESGLGEYAVTPAELFGGIYHVYSYRPAWSPDSRQLVFERELWWDNCWDGGGGCAEHVPPGMMVAENTSGGGSITPEGVGIEADWGEPICPPNEGYPIWLVASGTDPGAPEWTNAVEYIGRIADNIGGLYVYEAPIINAPFLANASGEPELLPWGSGYCVHARIAHEITYNVTGGEQTYKEVWYRISEDASPGEWILAGIQVSPVGTSGIGGETYVYIDGWDVSQNPLERDPVDIVAENDPIFENPPETIPFEYNRDGAGGYARDESVNNFADSLSCYVNDPPINGSDNCPLGLNRVALDDTLFKQYADITGIQGATGSAVFMSQAIWHGGLPMILATTAGSCGQDSSDHETSGWRYCPGVQPLQPAQNSSRKWRHHEALIEHITHLNEQANTTTDPYVIPVLSTTNFYVVGQYRDDNIGTWNDFISIHGEPKQPDPRITLTWEDFIERSNLDLVKEGDYMFDRFIDQWADFITNDPNGNADNDDLINSLDNCPRTDNPLQERTHGDPNNPKGDACNISTHGFLVVGWGPVMACADVEVTGNDNLNFEYDASGGFVAPYVADFGLGGNTTAGFEWRQYPGPRPFYCVISDRLPKHSTDPNSPIDPVIWPQPWYGGRENEVWEFYRLPDTFSLGGSGKPFAVDRISAPNFELWQ